ncbi:MAG: DUF302 domain-containing protein [Spirochaetales bacterium]|nr:DUF302 domain-containing protein [Spirochaetales bacterium]
MNIAYFRKSSRGAAETLAALKNSAGKAGFTLGGETVLNKGTTTVLNACRPEWAETVAAADPALLGLLPCSVMVIEKEGVVSVGAALPAVLADAVASGELKSLAVRAEKTLRGVVEQAAGVGPLKPMKLKLYSTHSCPYCKMEKAWLDERKTPHELVYVDDDQKEAESLVRRSGQMGVPVTEVIYGDDESEFVIGFDRPKLEAIVAEM